MTLHWYHIQGLTVASELALPDARAGSQAPDPIRVTLAPRTQRCSSDRVALIGDAGFATLFLPEAATFELSAGREIRIIPHVDDAETLRTFLLGSAWAVLLHQRGLLPLHGCALAWRNAVWLFVGERGAGKSTLAAALLRAGAALVSDDVTAIHLPEGRPSIWPGLQSMKLTPAAAEAVPAIVLGPAHDGAKLRIVPEQLAPDHVLPLAGVVELARTGGAQRLIPVTGSDACAIAVRHTFRGLAAPLLGLSRDHLSACAALASQTAFLRFERPWDAAAVEPAAAWLLAEGLPH